MDAVAGRENGVSLAAHTCTLRETISAAHHNSSQRDRARDKAEKEVSDSL